MVRNDGRAGGGRSSGRRLPTEEELSLWRFAVRDAVPMPGRVVQPIAVPPQTETAPETVASAPRSVPLRPLPARLPLEPGVSRDMDHHTADRLRRGRVPIDARIDLHGMTQAEAHEALVGMVPHCRNQGRRCLLVITGKGAMTPGGGVLRREAPRWLAEPATARLIVAIQPAHSKDGGDGALYVLLRKRRDGR